MQRMCKVCGGWHDLEQPWPAKCERHFIKGAAPNVISDTIEPTIHHGVGRKVDSKREFQKLNRAHGFIDLGNETIKPRQPVRLDRGQRRDAIRQSLYQLRNGQA